MDTKTHGRARQEMEDRRDRILVKELLSGDREAFERLYKVHVKRVFGFCCKICGNPDDAADAVHEAFVDVVRRLPSLDIDKLSFGGYLLVTARNTCIKERRRMARAQLAPEMPEFGRAAGSVETAIDPERSLLISDQRRQVRFANDKLAPRQRQALALRELGELSYREIAKELDLSENAVAQLISRARLRLRAEIRGMAAPVKQKSTNCLKAVLLISKHLDGELEEIERTWLDSHIASCERCRESLDDVEEAGAMYRSLWPAASTVEIARRLFEDEALASLIERWQIDRGPNYSEQRIGELTTKKGKRRPIATTVYAVALITAILGGVAVSGNLGAEHQLDIRDTARGVDYKSIVPGIDGGYSWKRPEMTVKRSKVSTSAFVRDLGAADGSGGSAETASSMEGSDVSSASNRRSSSRKRSRGGRARQHRRRSSRSREGSGRSRKGAQSPDDGNSFKDHNTTDHNTTGVNKPKNSSNKKKEGETGVPGPSNSAGTEGSGNEKSALGANPYSIKKPDGSPFVLSPPSGTSNGGDSHIGVGHQKLPGGTPWQLPH